MKQKLCLLFGLLVLWAGTDRSLAQITAVAYDQSATTYNQQSTGGVPTSTVAGTPPGSNGKGTTVNSSYGAVNLPSPNQFASMVSFGGLSAPTNWTKLAGASYLNGRTAFSGKVAQAMQLPVGTSNNTVVIVFKNVQIGNPMVSSPVLYYLGSVIPPPSTDVNGNVLGATNATTYWQTVPYQATSTNNNYYYSPNAGVVFATQPGQVQITWVTAGSYADVSQLNYVNPGGLIYPSFTTNGGAIYLLYTASYQVSTIPVKPAQQIYWTEATFQALGYPVSLPQGRVTAIHVAYNSSFPQTVATPYQDPNSSPAVGQTNTEVRTLWLDTSVAPYSIHADNAVGLVFVELLGQPNPGGLSSQYLGFELVNVQQSPTAEPVTIDLGDQMTPFQDGWEATSPTPYPVGSVTGSKYYYSLSTTSGQNLYADILTTHTNDCQVYWLTAGVAGVNWPDRLVNYSLVWPGDPSQYSYYLRPPVATAAAAAATGVQLDSYETPSIDYQDPLDQLRGFITSSDVYYSWLTPAYPAHRALLRFNANSSVRFERVLSLLEEGLQNNALLAGSVATNLDSWNPTNSTLTNYVAGYSPPYVIHQTVNVGDQITAPAGELGTGTNLVAGDDYFAGYINTNLDSSLLGNADTNIGTSYDPAAYADPLIYGFDIANLGAIIPVNAIPGHNELEVWWFRQNNADPANGFQYVYWPAVIGDYTIQWPQNAAKIVLASNAGSGPLDSLHAAGGVYYQNDPTLPGYNPNEEHALMLGGQVYALRDDLNITNANTTPGAPFGGYSSAPFVLLQYDGSDGRPAMQAFQVQREDPSAGIFFDYVVAAGTQLQAPMPLPLMAQPITANTNYETGVTNYDTAPTGVSGDLPAGWTTNSAGGEFNLYQGFTFEDRKNNFWVYRGLNAGLPPLQAGAYDPVSGSFGPLPAATAVVGTNFLYYIPVSRQFASLTLGASAGVLPAGLTLSTTTNGLCVSGVPTAAGSSQVTLLVTDTADDTTATVNLSITVVASGSVATLGPLVLTSTNSYSGTVETFSNRPPVLAAAATPTNSFTMNFYYKTLAGFAWPGYATPPPVGSIVPYLLPVSNGVPTGDPTSSNTPSLNIVYRPVWPELINGQPLPTLQLGQTLTTAVNGLTAVRGQDSVQVLYQQSIATNATLTDAAASVVLYDPTVQKAADVILSSGLPLPASVLTDVNNGLDYFPNLPANLISRLWFDPSAGVLYFQGQFVADPVNGNYVMLNVLRGSDLAAVNGLCTAADPDYADWTNTVANLAVYEYTFAENPLIPGSYLINTNDTLTCEAGDLVAVTNSDTAVDSYALSAAGPGQGYVTYVVANDLNPKLAGDPITVAIARVGQPLFPGALVVVNAANASPFSQLITFQHTADLAGETSDYLYDWRIEPPVNGQPPALGTEASWTQLSQPFSGPVFTLGASGVQGLSDNYVSMRYAQLLTNGDGSITTNWSAWANPILAEGWLTRVTQNLDPVSGETQNLYNNAASTTASLIELAGARWNGDVPLNESSITNNGLIQLYETVLDMGKSLSINAGINYGPANQALLNTAGYLNDLYTTLGNDAWANSLNPTIGFGTSDTAYGSIATSQFVFEGEEPTLLAQNLALLRGRDDSVSPGVDVPPVYNHLWWNYTYGIDAGQVIYALNYNITDLNSDGKVNAADAAILYPQGHGDAYGHYLTALMNYFELLMNPNFDWVPESQTVSVLGAAVTVNYQDEQKFAATAAALARTGRQIFDLEWRQDYEAGTANGWGYFATNYVGQYTFINNNGGSQHITRYWGMDHWAARVGAGTYLNWVVGNSILPPKDLNPKDQGVQIVDRTTVQDLQELPATAAALENDMDNANAGFNPLGLSQNAIPFDINPNQVTGANPQTHFEQIYARAVQALNNAVVAFNAAQNVTQDLRQQQNSLSALQASITAQELAYNDQLIELYGTPYPDDMGPGGTWPQGYTGPDLIHYMYVDNVNTNNYNGILAVQTSPQTYQVDTQNFPTNWFSSVFDNFNFIEPSYVPDYGNSTNYVDFNIGTDAFSKPGNWASERANVGSIEQAATAVNNAEDALRTAAFNAQSDKQSLDLAMALVTAQEIINSNDVADQQQIVNYTHTINDLNSVYNILNAGVTAAEANIQNQFSVLSYIPTEFIFGLADGGDEAKAALIPPTIALDAAYLGLSAGNVAAYTAEQISTTVLQNDVLNLSQQVAVNQNTEAIQNAVSALGQEELSLQNDIGVISAAQVTLNSAQANYQTLVSQGNRLQQERLTFREHAAAEVQGDTVANASFLIFQNEDLERYTTLFNLAAQYAYMAANAYDYETGLLRTPAGQAFVNQIISSCALGVIQNGEPQISGTTTGDPGLANALAEMWGDWSSVKGRLGFNNPDGYGTIASLRSENYRILPGSAGNTKWQELLQNSVLSDLNSDPDVANNCLQVGDGSGAAVPGIELTFGTTITDGENLFGQPLGPGDHAYSSSSFATKIFAVGVDFDGYVGMDNPVSNSGAAGTTPTDPTLDPNGLSATPYCYLIPCGADSMRSPPLGDTSTVRTWNVDDVAIPLPFNIGASSFSDAPFYQAADSLSEPLFAVRKQQAFRPVSSLEAFNTSIYGATGSLQPSQYTNQRLIGRSIWNSRWKLIIPGYTLLADPNEGIARFINSVSDIHLYFVTYSYAGN